MALQREKKKTREKQGGKGDQQHQAESEPEAFEDSDKKKGNKMNQLKISCYLMNAYLADWPMTHLLVPLCFLTNTGKYWASTCDLEIGPVTIPTIFLTSVNRLKAFHSGKLLPSWLNCSDFKTKLPVHVREYILQIHILPKHLHLYASTSVTNCCNTNKLVCLDIASSFDNRLVLWCQRWCGWQCWWRWLGICCEEASHVGREGCWWTAEKRKGGKDEVCNIFGLTWYVELDNQGMYSRIWLPCRHCVVEIICYSIWLSSEGLNWGESLLVCLSWCQFSRRLRNHMLSSFAEKSKVNSSTGRWRKRNHWRKPML